jgi:type II secretory pathway component GspD/PulD (secretin)
MRAPLTAWFLLSLAASGAIAAGPGYELQNADIRAFVAAVERQAGYFYEVDDEVKASVSVSCRRDDKEVAPVLLAATLQYHGLRFTPGTGGQTRIVRSYTPSATSPVRAPTGLSMTVCLPVEDPPAPERVKALRSGLAQHSVVLYYQPSKLLIVVGEPREVLAAVK